MIIDYNTREFISTLAVDIYEFDAIDGTEIRHSYATSRFTYNSVDYLPYIADEGVVLGNQINDTLGGLQSLQWICTVNLINTIHVSDLLESNTLMNNKLVITLFQWNSLDSASPDNSDVLYEGLIKSREFNDRIWSIKCEHIVSDLIKPFPVDIISLVTLPRTDPDNYGKPIPFVFGQMNISPFSGQGRTARAAPCVDTSGAPLGGFLSSKVVTSAGGLLEYNNNAWYEVVDVSQNSDNSLTITSSKRRYRSYIAVDTGNNSLTEWETFADGRSDSNVDLDAGLADGEFFEGTFTSSSDRGAITSAKLYIERTGLSLFSTDWGVTLSKEGVDILTGSPDIMTDNRLFIQDIDISDLSWNDLALLTVKLPKLDLDITQVYIEIEFLRGEEDTIPDIYQLVTGFSDVNPINQIKTILTHSSLCGIPISRIDEDTFTEAARIREGWEFSFVLDEVKGADFINTLLQECAAFLYIKSNKIACGVRTNVNDPVHAIIDPNDVILSGIGVFCDFLPENRIVNDVSLRYRYDYASNKYERINIASSLARNSEAVTATFNSIQRRWDVSNTAQAGDKVYDVNTGKIHDVISATSSHIVVSPYPTKNGRILYGPNLSAVAIRSRYANKLSRSMGGKIPNFSELGSYDNRFIAKDAVAELWVNSVLSQLAQPVLIAKIATYWKYNELNIGDTVLFDSPSLPDSRRPFVVDQTANPLRAESYYVTVATRNYDAFQVGEYILIDSEVMKVVSKGQHYIKIDRGLLDSNISEHADGADIRVFSTKYQVKNISIDINNLLWNITIERVSPYYRPRPILATGSDRADKETSLREFRERFYLSNVSGLMFEGREDVLGPGLEATQDVDDAYSDSPPYIIYNTFGPTVRT